MSDKKKDEKKNEKRCTCGSKSGSWHTRGCALLPRDYDPQGDR